MKCNLNNEDLAKALEVMNYLENNYQNRLDYENLVTKFHINEYKLKHAFKEVARDNIHAFLTKVRMQQAKRLLETTDLPVKYIAYKVGLDKSNLNIQFKKYTGKTPSDWRIHSKAGFKLYYQHTLDEKDRLEAQQNNTSNTKK